MSDGHTEAPLGTRVDGERLPGGQDLPRPAFARLVALARKQAREQHVDALMRGWSEHVDIDEGANFTNGFERCPHPDCRLVREARQIVNAEREVVR